MNNVISANQILETLGNKKRTIMMNKPKFVKTFSLFGNTIFFAIGKTKERNPNNLYPNLIDFATHKLKKGAIDCGYAHCTTCYQEK